MLRFKNEVDAWVYWCAGWFEPRIWIREIWGDSYLCDHFLNKFDEYYSLYGDRGVMNKFYLELSDGHQVKLYEWVMNNYAQDNWASIREELYKKY